MMHTLFLALCERDSVHRLGFVERDKGGATLIHEAKIKHTDKEAPNVPQYARHTFVSARLGEQSIHVPWYTDKHSRT
jgi:hypothetical protein